MFWQLAYSVAADEFAKRFARLEGSIHYIPLAAGPRDAQLSAVLLPDPKRLGRPFDLAPEGHLSKRTLVEIRRSRDHLRQGDTCQ